MQLPVSSRDSLNSRPFARRKLFAFLCPGLPWSTRVFPLLSRRLLFLHLTPVHQPGKTNAAWAPIFAHLPRVGEQVTVDGLTLDASTLLPANKGYYSFAGSLTTPPCSEGVQWMVLKEPVKLGAQQIKAFRQLYNANARPVQPLNGRIVKEST